MKKIKAVVLVLIMILCGAAFAREMLSYDDADLGTCKSPGRSGTEQEGN